MTFENIKGFLSLWAILGYFLMPGIIKPKNKKQAFIQWFIGGPLFWLGVLVYGVPILFNKYMRTVDK
jgi:hypothetical protein